MIGYPGRQAQTHFCIWLRLACHVRHRLLGRSHYEVHAHSTQKRTPTRFGQHSPEPNRAYSTAEFLGCLITDGSTSPKARGFRLDSTTEGAYQRCTAIRKARYVLRLKQMTKTTWIASMGLGTSLHQPSAKSICKISYNVHCVAKHKFAARGIYPLCLQA